jgi:hypothetical protein
MLAAIAMVLAWTGYDMPLPRKKEDTPPDNFVYSLWVATGQTNMHGTTTAGTKRALAKLLPDAPIFYGAGTPDEIIQLLEDGAAIRVTARCSQLPAYLRRWTGSYAGGHAFAVIGTRVNAGVREVFWMDPFGRSELYQGRWIPWSDVSGVLSSNADGIKVAFGYKSAACPPPPINGGGNGSTDMIISNVVELSRGTVGASTPILHPQTLATIMVVGPKEVRIVGESPDGKYLGVLVRSKKIEGKNPKIALVEKVLVSNLSVASPCMDVEDALAAAQAEVETLTLKLNADKEDAQHIVER